MKICSNCTKKVIDSYMFRELFIESNEWLRRKRLVEDQVQEVIVSEVIVDSDESDTGSEVSGGLCLCFPSEVHIFVSLVQSIGWFRHW